MDAPDIDAPQSAEVSGLKEIWRLLEVNNQADALAKIGTLCAAAAPMASQDSELADLRGKFEWLEAEAKKSRTGISFDWVPSMEGEPSGWRFMRQHFIGEAGKSLVSAINKAQRAINGIAGR